MSLVLFNPILKHALSHPNIFSDFQIVLIHVSIVDRHLKLKLVLFDDRVKLNARCYFLLKKGKYYFMYILFSR